MGNAGIALRRSRTEYAFATGRAGTTGNTGPSLALGEVYRLLDNWQCWAASWFPDLGVQPPPWAAQWYPHLAWDEGWGSQQAPDAIPDPVDERLAEWTDRLLMRLPRVHLLTLKRHYINRRPQQRLILDAACRALADLAVRR